VSASGSDGTRHALAALFPRVVLGLIFFQAGCYKVFVQTPVGHAKQWFLPFADTFLPVWSLWAMGVTIPFAELIGGLLVLLGLYTTAGLALLGAVLCIVTFGHLLHDPLYAFHEHVFPRLVLTVLVLALPRAWDRFSLDAWRAKRSGAA
jgi:uncharacterized membrane protein YphA (DoxX/SURF4 family)